ncbi:MAG: hypothetical protein ACLSUF_02915 [Oscillospiraceae bacterium]
MPENIGFHQELSFALLLAILVPNNRASPSHECATLRIDVDQVDTSISFLDDGSGIDLDDHFAR